MKNHNIVKMVKEILPTSHQSKNSSLLNILEQGTPLGPGTPPRTRYTSQTRYTPWDQVHLYRTRYTPQTRYTPPRDQVPPLWGQVHPPDQVHPLECILVFKFVRDRLGPSLKSSDQLSKFIKITEAMEESYTLALSCINLFVVCGTQGPEKSTLGRQNRLTDQHIKPLKFYDEKHGLINRLQHLIQNRQSLSFGSNLRKYLSYQIQRNIFHVSVTFSAKIR